MLNITLFVPGLFDTEIAYVDEHDNSLSSLQLLLARAKRNKLEDLSYNAALCSLFGYYAEVGQDLPMAAIGRLIDDDKRPEGYWMRADPVHLIADQRSLRLLDASNLALTQHDALVLAASLRESFTELGWELEVPIPTRWYVKMNNKPDIQTSEIHSVVGDDIKAHMPRGNDAVIWHRLMNEIQMQLHDADINQLRVDRGELAVNSLWLWGAGTLPDLLERRWSRVYGEDNNTMGLAMLSNTPCLALPERAEDLFDEDNKSADILLVLSEFQTSMAERDQRGKQLRQFDQQWCSFFLEQLKKGSLGKLRILTRTSEFTLGKYSLMKLWKKVNSFNYYVID